MVDRVIAPYLSKWQAPKERALAVRWLSALLADVPTQLPFGPYGSLWCVGFFRRLHCFQCSLAHSMAKLCYALTYRTPLLSLCLSLLGTSQPNVPEGDAQEDERFVELATDQFAGSV